MEGKVFSTYSDPVAASLASRAVRAYPAGRRLRPRSRARKMNALELPRDD